MVLSRSSRRSLLAFFPACLGLATAMGCGASPARLETPAPGGEAAGDPTHLANLSPVDPAVVARAAGVEPRVGDDGVARIAWPRDDVPVTVDGTRLRPPAGLTSWAAFTAAPGGAMVMGDTVVFQDEVDAAMDAAFAHGLEVTALHNHFLFDEPPVFFMHVGGSGEAGQLAAAVRAVWDAIRAVRAEAAHPATSFEGDVAVEGGTLDAAAIGEILGLEPTAIEGVVRVSVGREGTMHGVRIGGSMGLETWAAFSGSDAAATVDGDFIMTAEEIQPVLRALRTEGIHVVALHNHMVGGEPFFYFTHFWGTGTATGLAAALRRVLDVQERRAD